MAPEDKITSCFADIWIFGEVGDFDSSTPVHRGFDDVEDEAENVTRVHRVSVRMVKLGRERTSEER